jgi:hypothetical protein
VAALGQTYKCLSKNKAKRRLKMQKERQESKTYDTSGTRTHNLVLF